LGLRRELGKNGAEIFFISRACKAVQKNNQKGKYEHMTLTSILKEEFLKAKLQLENLFSKVGKNL